MAATAPRLTLREQRTLLGRYLRPQRGKFGLLGVLLIGNLALQLANPLILRAFIDAALAQQSLETLIGGALLFIAVALATQAVAVAETYVAEDVGWGATNQMRADLTAHLLGLDISFHNGRTPGELIERVDGDVTALANFFSRFVLLVAGNGVLLIGVLVLLWREEWHVGLAMTVFALITTAVLIRSRNFGVEAATAQRQATADLFGFLEERMAGLDDLRANGATAYVLRRYYERMRAVFTTGMSAEVRQALLFVITIGLFTAGYITALGMGIWLFQAGAISLGTVYLFFAYADMLRRPLDQITDQLQELQKAGAGMARVQELYALHPAITDPASADLALSTHGPAAVEFDGVSFGYGDATMVLQDVSLHLEPGTVLGVVGRTGSGKTTLSRLLLRLYDPAVGTIRLDGTDIRRLPLATLRARIGVVTQEVQLFQASVRDNLALFDPALDDTRIITILHDLGLGDWLAALPNGLNSELPAGGGGLSAGQAQLLAFARVFLRDPGLVILDEASSRLDPATERLIERAVDRLLQGRTAIIIAHRLGTVERADRILVMDGGRVVENAPRAALALDPDSRFHALLRAGLDLAEVPA
ncbi:MAG: ABC transporter ATP-binding protein/permease [Chloroflexota bacterium]|nr:ABC transporter ATP-binding protein/permease [Chloroflexota bacterium]